MRALFKLNAANPTLTVGSTQSLPWTGPAEWVAVANATSNAIWVRATAPDPPTSEAAADFVIPPSFAMAFPVNSPYFGFRFASSSLIASGGLLSQAYIIIGRHEPMPQFGAYNFTSVATSQIVAAPVSVTGAPTTVGPYDLSAWGGLAVSIIGDQTVSSLHVLKAIYQHSADLLTWVTAATIPIFPNTIYSIQFPRYQQYARLLIQDPLGAFILPGTMNVSVTPRATLTEITSIQVSANAEFIVGLSVGPSTTRTIDVYTEGLQQVDEKINFVSTSTPVTGVTLAIYQSLDGSNFALQGTDSLTNVVATTQLYDMSLPYPQAFVRYVIQNTDPTNTLSGNLAVIPSYQPSPLLQDSKVPIRAANGAIINLGNSGDAAMANTIIGLLKQIANRNNFTLASTAFLTGIAGGSVNTWVNTGITLPANSEVMAVTAAHAVAGSTLLLAMGAGTIPLIFTVNSGQVSLANTGGLPIGANTTIQVQSNTAGQTAGALWYK